MTIQTLFCGKTCQCKNRCEGFFPQSQTLQKGCKNACKSGYDVQSKEDYLLSFVGETESIDHFNIDPNPTNDTSRCSLPGAERDPVCNPALLKKPNYTWAYLVGGAIIVALVVVIIRRMR